MIQREALFTIDGEQREQYAPEKFIGRNIAVGQYQEAIQLLITEGKSEILNFWGIEGIGKSWLLQHLAAITEQTLDDELFDLRMSDHLQDDELPYDFISISFPTEVGEAAFDMVQTKIASTDPTKRIILLIDDAHNCPEEVWGKIEAELLAPLLEKYFGERSGVVVVAGNKPVPYWYKENVRALVRGTQETQLSAFGTEEMSLKSRKKFGEKEISPVRLELWSAGSPAILSILLEKFYEELGAENLQKYEHTPSPELLAYLEKILEALTLEVSENGLDESFQALAVLRRYRSEDLQFMLEKTSEEEEIAKEKERDDLYYMQQIGALKNRTNIVSYNGYKYVTSLIVRRLREIVLEHSNLDLLLRQHERAAQLYWDKAVLFTNPPEEIIEYWYHLGRIATLRKESPEWLETKALEILTTVQGKLRMYEINYLRQEAPPWVKISKLN